MVGVVVLALLANAGQRSTSSSARGRKARSRLLAHRVEQLLWAGGPAHHALDARVDGLIVTHSPVTRLRDLAEILLAIAQVVVVGLLIVAALAPDPGGEARGRNGDGEDQGHPVAEGAAAGGAGLAAVVAVVGEGHAFTASRLRSVEQTVG